MAPVLRAPVAQVFPRTQWRLVLTARELQVSAAAEAKFASSFKRSGRADHEVLVDLSQSMSRSPWGASRILFGAGTFCLFCMCVFVAAWDDVSV